MRYRLNRAQMVDNSAPLTFKLHKECIYQMSDTKCEVYDSQSLFCIQLSISSRDLKITSFSNRHQSDQCFASNISSSPNILKQISITCAQRQLCNCAFQVLKSQCIVAKMVPCQIFDILQV